MPGNVKVKLLSERLLTLRIPGCALIVSRRAWSISDFMIPLRAYEGLVRDPPAMTLVPLSMQ